MGKSTPQAPPPPDPRVVSAEQAKANIETATAQQKLNMVGSTGPQGTVDYVADPSQPGGYRQVTALSPEQQAIWDAQKKTELGATNIAYDQLGRVQNALNTPLDTSGLPGLQGGPGRQSLAYEIQPAGKIQSDVAIQNSFNPGQQVQGQVGGDLETARRNAEQAVYQQATSRLDPRFQTEEQSLDTKLANQGLSINSAAYENAKRQFNQGKNDAYNQAQYSAIQAGEQAAQGQFGRQLNQGQFANQAAGQMYQQNMGQAGFFNDANLAQMQARNAAQGQKFDQNMAQAQFYNQAMNQGFNQSLASNQMDNQARNQGLQERAYQQNQPINQLTGLLSLGQVQGPQGVQYTPSQVAPTDVTGAYGLQQQAYQSAANRAAQQQSGLMSGLMSLGGAAILASDRNLKTDVRLIRRRKDGLGVYAFRYLDDPEGVARIGVMAQEVKRVRPDLVVKRADGFLAVNYAGLDLAAA